LIQAENNTVKLMIIRREKLKGLSLLATDAGEDESVVIARLL
jgi:hypothetical protein